MSKDPRLSKGIESNRLLLYVPSEKKQVLDQLLKRIPATEARSLSAAIFTALEAWLEEKMRAEDFRGMLLPVFDTVADLTPEMTNPEARRDVYVAFIKAFLRAFELQVFRGYFHVLEKGYKDPLAADGIRLIHKEYDMEVREMKRSLPPRLAEAAMDLARRTNEILREKGEKPSEQPTIQEETPP